MPIDLLSIKPHKVSRDLSGYVTYIWNYCSRYSYLDRVQTSCTRAKEARST